ncbi:MAG TPA: ribosome maturation factor RimM [Acidimicrobiales bacterium]|jgi:16S rRNA processing protein RimM|nr:ribosome maturation factor RimM [Acidimicrobiales bacterium]
MPAPDPGGRTAPLLEIGRVTRPHGLRGEVVVDLTTDRVERLAPGTVLASDVGDLTVGAARPHQRRWIVAFEGHTGREAADRLRGVALRARALDDPDELWVHQLVGSDVVTVAGHMVGTCVAVVANPASDLLELDGGALVPVVFVVERRPGQVTIDPPEGLLEL